MLNPFTPLPAAARREHLAAYREFLEARDGAVDMAGRTLSRREASMRRFTEGPSIRTIDRAHFDAQYVAFDRKRKTSTEMLLLLALVKVNAAEAYGVNTTFEKILARIERAHEDDLEMVLLIEESYHTRILLSSTHIYGFEVTEPFHPPLSLRTMISAIGGAPVSFSRPLVLASELVGTILFSNILTCAHRLLADDPEVRDAIEERIIEVLVDEIGHVTFNRLCLGPLGLQQSHLMLSMVARGMEGVIPELGALGLSLSTDESVLDRLPGEVRRQAFVV